jgi:hypothetical protein
LSHRKYGGPRAEDMSALDVADPLVALRLSHCGAQAGSVSGGVVGTAVGGCGGRGGVGSSGVSVAKRLPSLSGPQSLRDDLTSRTDNRAIITHNNNTKAAAQEYKYNTEFGLRHTTDPATLTLNYHVNVNMHQVYGKFNPAAAARLMQANREEFSRDSLLGLISSTSAW